MFSLSLGLAGSVLTGFAPPRAWVPGWGGAPDIPFSADFAANGNTEMVAFDPRGDGAIYALPTRDGFKPADGVQILPNFGKGCQAITIGSTEPGKPPIVVGLFAGTDLRLAIKAETYPLKVTDNWATLPHKLGDPVMAMAGGKVFVFSSRDGNGYTIDPANPKPVPTHLPNNTVWLGDAGQDFVGKDNKGNVFWIDRTTLQRKADLGKESPGSRPAAMPGLVVFGDTAWTPTKTITLDADNNPKVDVIRTVGHFGKSARPVIYEWRRGTELGTGSLVELRRGIIAEDATLKDDDPESDAYNRVSGNDGLLDGWKKYGYRGLDLAGMGCKVGHADVICLISRFEGVKPETLDAGIKRITSFYSGLKVKNADGTEGINFHPVLLDPIKGDDAKSAWWVNRGKFLPDKWRGMVHWMQVTPGGGGQANELADGGTCGEGALWAVFVHEFGHQLGLNHEGFSPGYASPIYTSLMNYTYSYHFEDTINNIHYSDGRFAALKLREDDLDETLPFPYEQVKFLEKGPYHFPLKADGDKTLVDWNRNGIFGEKHVRSSITYAYSISGGTRDELGRSHTKTAPWLLEHQGQAFLLYGINDLPGDVKTDPTISPEKPGRLILRRMVKPTIWESETILDSGGLTGDPVGVSYNVKILTAYQTLNGVMARWVSVNRDNVEMSSPLLLDADKTLIPTIGAYAGHAYVFLQNPANGKVTYRIFDRDKLQKDVRILEVVSSNPVGLTTDTKSGEAIMALAQDQDKGRTFRWQYRRFSAGQDGVLKQTKGPFWVDGEAGGSRGNGRMIALFDSTKDAGPNGRVIIICKGLTSAATPWACCYQAHEIADPKFNGGWLVKRYYDEWTTSRSAPAAMWFKGDMLYSYRWADGSQGEGDNILHVAYRGSGLQTNPLTDFDDLSYIRNFGLSNSIPTLGNP